MSKEQKIEDLINRVRLIRLENLTKDEIGDLSDFFYCQHQLFEQMYQEIDEFERGVA